MNHPKQLALSCLISLLILFNCSSKNNKSNDTNQNSGSISLKLITKGLMSPTEMAVPNDGTNRIFITEQKGLIRIIQNGKLLEDPFLDLRPKMVTQKDQYSETGLLGLAFHPQFKSNHKFYVYYSAPSSKAGSHHKSIIAEYRVSPNQPNKADLSERKIMEIEQPESNHNGGHLEFGPDGFIYIASGDGGGGGDRHGTIGNGQNLNTLLGKILRININDSKTYTIPSSNPFINRKDAKAEIWAYGLRNPWKFSFDNKGRLFCADVGQDNYEEVNIIEKGKNYGWRIMEGKHCFNPSNNCKTEGLVNPIFEYSHKIGLSVTGGYYYEGNVVQKLKNKYVFADWTGVFFAIDDKGNGGKITLKNIPEGLKVLSFGKDTSGELYVLTSLDTQPLSSTGAVYKIVEEK